MSSREPTTARRYRVTARLLPTVAKKTLPYCALPLAFRLFRPLGSAHSSPTACLSVNLPLRHHGAHEPARTEDLREGPTRPTVEVLRLIDPEHREPFVSLGRLFLACTVTPVEGLLRFDLDRLDYSTSLGGLAPVLDLWVPLRIARAVASELGVLDELAALLEWETRGAYSVEDREEGGIVHNWKIASNRIPPDEYSTSSMLSTRFPRLQLLPPGSQVRTLLAPLSSFPAFLPHDDPTRLDAVWSKLVEWSVLAYESFLDADAESDEADEADAALPGEPPTSRPTRRNDAASLVPFFLFSTLAPLLVALSTLPIAAAAAPGPPSELAHLPAVPPLGRADLLPRSGSDAPPPPQAGLYLVDAIARVVLFAHRTTLSRALSSAPVAATELDGATEGEGDDRNGWRADVDARLAALETAAGAASRADDDDGQHPQGDVVQRLSVRLADVEGRLHEREREGPSERVALETATRGARRLRMDVGVLLAVFVLGVATGVGVLSKWR